MKPIKIRGRIWHVLIEYVFVFFIVLFFPIVLTVFTFNFQWPEWLAFLLTSFIAIFFIYQLARPLHFVVLTNENLIIKNHIRFWQRNKFPLEKINSVNLISKYSSYEGLEVPVTCIKVDLRAKQEKVFRADAFSDRDWKKLIESLEERGVIVIDEIGYTSRSAK